MSPSFENKNEKCNICFENDIEIIIPCEGNHSYCFSCIKKCLLEKKGKLICPECRTRCNYFLVSHKEKIDRTDELNNFLEFMKIIPIDNNKMSSSGLYPIWTIISYVFNTRQYEYYKKNIESIETPENSEKLRKSINWFKMQKEITDKFRI
jgi:hypothetical protein